MTHVAFQPRGPELELDADYVVVGSGAGGASAAVTLARGGASVALVEAGPWRDPPDYPSSVYGTMRDMFEEWGSTFTRGRAFWPIVQGALVGGSTVINSAICVRTPEDVLATWQKERGVGGQPMLRELWRIQAELERELGAEEVPEAARGRSNALAMLGATRLPLPGSHYTTRYVRGCEGAGQCLQGCRAGRKQSMNVTFIPELLTRGGRVLSSAPVTRVRMSGTRATGVEGRFRHPSTRERGARFVVHARRGVVVAASVTHSSRLLRRSGLRMPALGEHFHTHPGAPLIGVYDDPVDMSVGATQGWASVGQRESSRLKLETIALPLDMLAGRLAGGGQLLMQRLRELRHMAVWAQATWCETPGRIGDDLLGRPAVHFTPSPADMARLRNGLVQVARLHFAAGAREVIPAVHGLPYKLGPDQLSVLEQAPLDPRAYVAILSHLFGGCVMGSDPRNSVCDERGGVHGAQALYVADASTIPTGLGVNPQHTIMALSRLFAEQMLEERKSSHTRSGTHASAA